MATSFVQQEHFVTEIDAESAIGRALEVQGICVEGYEELIIPKDRCIKLPPIYVKIDNDKNRQTAVDIYVEEIEGEWYARGIETRR